MQKQLSLANCRCSVAGSLVWVEQKTINRKGTVCTSYYHYNETEKHFTSKFFTLSVCYCHLIRKGFKSNPAENVPPSPQHGPSHFLSLVMIACPEWATGMCPEATYSLQYPMSKSSSVTMSRGKELWPWQLLLKGPFAFRSSLSHMEGWRVWDKSVQWQAGLTPTPRKQWRGFLYSGFLTGEVCNYWSADSKRSWAAQLTCDHCTCPTHNWGSLWNKPKCPSALHLIPLPYLSSSWQLPNLMMPLRLLMSWLGDSHFMRLQCLRVCQHMGALCHLWTSTSASDRQQ